MKNLWTLFIVGLFGVAILSAILTDSRASGNKDERIRKIEDSSISGLRAEVPSVVEMEKGLSDRESEIAERERRVKESEERIKVEEARVNDRIDQLQALLDEVDGKKDENKRTSELVLKKLVKTFESMNPKKAAGVISVMNDPLAVDLLMAMKEKKVAAVLDVMDPARATALSSLVAKRRPAGVPKSEEQLQPKEGASP